MKQMRYLLFVFMLLGCSLNSSAQNANFVAAYDCVERGSLDSAKMYIDKAMTDSATRKNAQVWYVRGFIYKELYKKYEKDNKQSLLRDSAMAALYQSYRIDSSQTNRKNVFLTIKFVASTFYNDAALSMDSLHYVVGITNYVKYKQAMKTINPATNFNATDILFYLKLGDVYAYLYFHTTPDKENIYLDSAKKAYNSVLAIDPNQVSANFNLAILYYNKATNIINRMDYDADIMQLNAAQDSSVNLMKMSLPYMLKTNNLDPCRKDAVKGLEGIYYLLHDTQKFDEFQQKLKQLENKQGNSPCK